MSRISRFNRNEIIGQIEHYLRAGAGPLFAEARAARELYYGKRVFLRGLIELTNYCGRDCLYCGIRRGNANLRRYRLSKAQIIDCVRAGRELGFHSFVLQGGEDAHYSDDLMTDIIASIKHSSPDTALTLSIGERPRESYQKYYDAGADRYLLRHESANHGHYAMLHPRSGLESRKRCLYDLKEIGFQVGAGFMTGSPHQTLEHLADDLLFLGELEPHMVGVGPFVPHKDTPCRDFPAGSLELTLIMLALCRVILPGAMLPATTALASIDARGRERALEAGANVVMPNLSPREFRVDYALYDNKISTGGEAAEALAAIKSQIEAIGYTPDLSAGHHYSRNK